MSIKLSAFKNTSNLFESWTYIKNARVQKTRASQEPVITHQEDSCQDQEHIKTIRSNFPPKFGSKWAGSSKRTDFP